MIRPPQPPLGVPWLLYGLLGCSLAMNLYMVLGRSDGGDERREVTATADTADQEPAVEPAPPAEPALPAGADQWAVTQGEVEHSLARTFQSLAGDDGDAISAVYARLFVWDLDLRRDLQRGDKIEVAWRRVDGSEPEIAAARLHSRKYGRTFTAYRWTAPGDTYASYWQEEGTEVPFRLVDGPIDEYEQITSLLKDRPTHKGMDFKTPVGTPVKSPRSGTVTRANWKWTANGNCLEIRFDDGTLAKFLHLEENKVGEGDRVAAGQLIASSGNTGRSTAPHLHYQLDRGSKVVDPVDYHQTTRRHLDPSAMAAFQVEVARYDAILGRAVAQR